MASKFQPAGTAPETSAKSSWSGIASKLSACPVATCGSRSGIIGQRQKSSTGSPRWFSVLMRSTTRPAALPSGRGRFCLSATTSVRVRRVSPT